MLRALRVNDGRRSECIPASRIYGQGARPTPEVEAQFFAGLRLANGTFKTTRDHRLDDVNAMLMPLLPPGKPLQIKDVAVSSGISTLEWMEMLRGEGIRFEM